MLKRTFVFLLACALAASCSARSSLGRLDPKQELVTLAPAWTRDLDLGVPLIIAPVPGGFAVMAADGRIATLEGAAGTLSWTADLQAPLTGTPVAYVDPNGVTDAWMAVPTGGSVRILGAGTGRIRAVIAGDQARESPHLSAIAQGLLLLEAGGDAVLADPLDGAELWRTTLPAPASAPGATCRGQMVLGLTDGRLAGLNAGTGELLWTKNLDSPVAVRPACDGKHVYVATRDNHLHALRLHRRSAGRMWKVKTGADPAAPPELVASHLLFLSKDTYLYGLKKRNGHLLFRIRLNRRPAPAAFLDELILVSGIQATRLDAYRLPRGTNAGGFTLPVGSRFVTPPVVSGDRVALVVARFGVTNRSRIIALSREPGKSTEADPVTDGDR